MMCNRIYNLKERNNIQFKNQNIYQLNQNFSNTQDIFLANKTLNPENQSYFYSNSYNIS